MTKPNSAEIICLLDRSGSMASIASDMEGGFNRFIDEQRKEPGECYVTLAQFDDVYETVYAHKALADVPPLSLAPRGSTALLDSLGKIIVETGERFKAMPEEERPEKVIVVIITDGHENASREFKRDAVMRMIKEQRDQWKWEFVYFGANQDAIAEAGSLGIAHAANFVADPHGTRAVYDSTSKGISNFRGGRGYTQN